MTNLSDKRLAEILRDAEAGVYNAMRAPTHDEMVALLDEVQSCRAEHQDMGKRMGLLHADLIQVQDERDVLREQVRVAREVCARPHRMCL